MFNWILDPIGWIITVPFWSIFVTIPFLLLKYIALGIEIIAVVLPKFLLFGGLEMSLSNLPSMFIRFVIIATALFFILWICVFFRYLFQNAESGVQSAKTAARFSLLCWVYIMVIPLGIFALYLLIDWLLDLIGATKEDENIARMLFLAITPEGVDKNAWESIANNNFFLSLPAFEQLGGMSNLYLIDFNMLLVFIISAGVLLAYLLAGITIVVKIFDQVFLFCISPIIATTSILDGGARISKWRDMAISKAFIVFGIVLGSRLYISLLGFSVENISIITGIESNSFWTSFPNYIVILLIAAGGALAFKEFGHVLASFLGEGYGISESVAQTRGIVTAFSSKGMVGKALGGTATGLSAVASGINNTKSKWNNRGGGSNSSINPGGGIMGRSNAWLGSKFSGSDEKRQSFRNEYKHHQIYSNYQKQVRDLNKWKTQQINDINSNSKLTALDKQNHINKINTKYEREIQHHKEQAEKEISELNKFSNQTDIAKERGK